MPIKSGTLEHLQFANQEILSAICQSMIGSDGYDSSKVYVLYGCVNTGSGSNYIISSGALFFNGEVYLTDGGTFTISGANVAEASISTTYFSAGNADPVSFNDGINRNVHEIRKATFAPGLSGSGMGDYVDFIFLSIVQSSQVLKKGNTTSFTPTLDYEPATKAYVDASALLKIKAHGTAIVGDIAAYSAHGTMITVPIGSTLANTNYKVQGTIVSLSTHGYDDATVVFAIKNKTTTSFDIYFQETAAITQNVNFDWILFQA
jgi:hypothetical protein